MLRKLKNRLVSYITAKFIMHYWKVVYCGSIPIEVKDVISPNNPFVDGDTTIGGYSRANIRRWIISECLSSTNPSIFFEAILEVINEMDKEVKENDSFFDDILAASQDEDSRFDEDDEDEITEEDLDNWNDDIAFVAN